MDHLHALRVLQEEEDTEVAIFPGFNLTFSAAETYVRVTEVVIEILT